MNTNEKPNVNSSATELTEKEKALRNEYYRKWRKRNPDRVKRYTKRYWEKKANAAGSSTSTDSDPVESDPNEGSEDE